MLAEAQRASMLQVMGIDVYRLRVTAAPAAEAARTHAAAIVVIGANAAVPAHFKLQLPRALGTSAPCVHWCDISAKIADDAAGYVAIGTEAARALGAQLSTMQQNRSIIATTAEPPALLCSGAAKRALWQVLKPVARRLREL
jgi:hypothetical protein